MTPRPYGKVKHKFRQPEIGEAGTDNWRTDQRQ